MATDPETGRVIYEQRQINQSKTEWNQYSFGVSLDQTLYDFGRTTNSIRTAKAIQKADQHRLISQRHQVIANVKKAYFDLLKAREVKDVYVEAVKAAKENMDYHESMMDIGLMSKAEIYQAKVNISNQRANLINAQNEIQFAKAALNNSMGRNPSTPFEIPQRDVAPVFPDYDFENAVEIALENNEYLKALNLQVKAEEFAIRQAKARYYPVISGGASYNRMNTDAGRVYTKNLDEDYAISIGANFNFNIFNGLADKTAIQRQILNKENALERLREEKRLLLTDVKQYFLQLKAFKDIIELNQMNIEAYEENLKLQREKRRVGSGTELEVTQAQVELVNAKETLVRARYNTKIAEAHLQAALGTIEQ
ncbi:MAG: TolC family protein [candidate division KSB1 bacterium]|nr:TolC family protein [candidate division KSB1 bacterium]